MYASASAVAFATACRAAPFGRSAPLRVSRAPVLLAPIRGHLQDAALGALPGRLPVLLDQGCNQAGIVDFDSGRLRGGRRAGRGSLASWRGGDDGGQGERAQARP